MANHEKHGPSRGAQTINQSVGGWRAKHDAIKDRVGIVIANCSTCAHIGSEGDGYEYNGTWSVCNKIERMGYLKSFPFKKEMICWEPEFWHSKFTDLIKCGEDEEVLAAIGKFVEARDSA